MKKDVKFRAGRRLVKGQLEYIDDRVFIYTPYNKILLAEIKSFHGKKWHGFDTPPIKAWSIPTIERNMFQLDYLTGGNPYIIYDQYMENPHSHEIIYPEFQHQTDLINQALSTNYCVWAAEMGTGKTLAAMVVMIESGVKDWWWFGPKSALYSVKLDMLKWKRWAEDHNVPKDKFPIMPKFYTYNALTKIMKNWDNDKAPHGVIFDESSKLKTPTAQRSKAALALVNGIREDWNIEGYAIQMTGTPSPKSPIDWWSQCEIACPGFLKEGDIHLFKHRLGIVEQRENTIIGGTYPHLVAWRDGDDICNKCGLSEAMHQLEDLNGSPNPEYHAFVKAENEVAKLFRRMRGLVQVKFKKECIDLPDKIYRIIECKPSAQLEQYARTVIQTAPRIITGLMMLRELSDGFLYKDEQDGTKECKVCHGRGKRPQEVLKDGYNLLDDGNILDLTTQKEYTTADNTEEFWHTVDDSICDGCGGSGQIPRMKRETKTIHSPKEDVLKDLLDEYEEAGRVVIYAGFQGSLDKVESICKDKEWTILRADGKGWKTNAGTVEDILQAMDQSHPDRKMYADKYEKIAFIGQPGAAGMGLNLTASPVIIYYSNDFNGENRIQSEDRVHRKGMDENRAPTIIDIINLESDRKILENLQKKRDLQNMSMGLFKSILNGVERVTYGDSIPD